MQILPDELMALALMDEHIENRLTPITLEWTAPTVFVIITALQVARRHPSLDGQAPETIVLAGTIDAAIADMIAKVREAEMPVSVSILEKGNDRNCDVATRQAPQAKVLIHRHCGHYAARDSRGGWSCQKCGRVERADLVEPAAAPSKDVH